MIVYQQLRDAAGCSKGSCFALGQFDGLHVGHQEVIGAAVKTAREQKLDSGVFTFSVYRNQPSNDTLAKRLYTPTLRESLLDAMGVDFVVYPAFEEFKALCPEDFVKQVLIDILQAKHVFCGQNYHFGKGASGDAQRLRRICSPLGVTVHVLPLVNIEGFPVSSTRIRGCVAQGDVGMAARLLGRPFAIDFEVIHGRKLARTFQYPTINQPFPRWFCVPKFGVYASRATIGARQHPSVTNVGIKPTVGSDRILAETYIHGFDGDLYGQKVVVELIQFIRPEMKFGSLEELRLQIEKDARYTVKI